MPRRQGPSTGPFQLHLCGSLQGGVRRIIRQLPQLPCPLRGVPGGPGRRAKARAPPGRTPA
eukprot:6017734-Alexandrium_andersonii.AAC.1